MNQHHRPAGPDPIHPGNFAPDGRRIFVWHGRDHKADFERLAEAIAETCGLFNDGGQIARAGENGELIQVGFADLQVQIGRSICGVRLVQHDDGRWHEEYYAFPFATTPRLDPARTRSRAT